MWHPYSNVIVAMQLQIFLTRIEGLTITSVVHAEIMNFFIRY
jgi:hypothetical protein